MAVTDTVRPASTVSNGVWTPSTGTRHGVTSDNNDATYISVASGVAGGVDLQTGDHTPPANHQRHRFRARMRTFNATAGTSTIRLTRGIPSLYGYGYDNSVTETVATEYPGPWSSTIDGSTKIPLAGTTAFMIGPNRIDTPAIVCRISELYIDIDCRQRPTYTPDVRDAAGVSQNGGTVTDTRRPTLVFGSVAYDGLPSLDWRVVVGGQTISGSGTPPTSVQPANLSNGGYTAEFRVRSTIQSSEPFEHVQSISFIVDIETPPPSPPANLTVTPVEDGNLITWEDPGGQPWSGDVVAEVYRVDCAAPAVQGLDLPGTVDSYASTPDNAALDITGDLDLRFDGTLPGWRPTLVSMLLAKHTATSDERSYSLALQPDGSVELGWSTAGTNASRTTVLSTEQVPYSHDRLAVRATLDVDNGSGQHVVTFYTAPTIDGVWTQLGAPVVLSGTTSVYSSTAILELGTFNVGTSFPLEGTVHAIEVRDGINGTVVANPNFNEGQAFGNTLLDTAGRLWTINGLAVMNGQGMERIAVIPDALSGEYLDRTPPVGDSTAGCDHEDPCVIAYRVRYWGIVGSTVEVPAELPAELIVGWPSTAGSIPAGWSRVTSLDARFPRGSANAISGATGGNANHAHTTSGHAHLINSHSHSLGGSTGTSNANTTSARFNGASQTQADQPHSHSRPANVNTFGSVNSGTTSPGTSTANNVPAYREVIWIASNGSQSAFPAGVLAYSAESVEGWTDDPNSTGRYLKGAAAAGNGGGTGGSNAHDHTVDAHTHTGRDHNHTVSGTGLSNPLSSTEAGDGSSDPRWLPRHTHPMSSGTSNTGALNSGSGGTTSSVSSEPPNRRLRVLQNVAGGLQIRIIGLYVGDIADLPPELVRCDGTNGTPDMRGWFARQQGADNVGSTGGTSTHSHTVPNHTHTMPNHSHTTDVGQSTTTSFQRPSFGDLGNSPTTNHDHTSGGTGNAAPSTGSAGSGVTNTVDHTPQYVDVHFVRLEGVASSPVDVPELIVTDFSSATIAPAAGSPGLDRLVGTELTLYLCTDRSYARPRQQAVGVPLEGGLPLVTATASGKDWALTITVQGRAALAEVEAMLQNQLIHFEPWGHPGGWYAPGPYQVRPNMRSVKTFTVTLVSQEPDPLPEPEDLL